MSLNHGINTSKADTNYSAVEQSTVGIPMYIGCWPAHIGNGYTGHPQIAYSFDEAKTLGGYSDDWRTSTGDPKWTLCEAMYSHFKLFGMAPAIFYNMFDPSTHKTAVASASKNVTDHCVNLGGNAIKDTGLTVVSGEDTLTLDTDYTAYYEDGELIVELLSGSDAYSATSLNIGYNEVSLTSVNATLVTSAIEKAEECKSRLGIVPDLLCAPGWSQTASVAAVMATKAEAINGQFKAKAVVDLDTSSTGADTYDDVATKKATGYTDENMIVCWPLAKVGDKLFNMSTIICGQIASIDADNDGVPYESPSNKTLPITGCVNKAGTEILLTLGQADTVSYTAGVVTAMNYDGWVAWGNFTGANTSTDVAKKFICTSRMMDYICNTFIDTYWSYIDQPLTRVLIDAIINSFNSWLAGLTNEGKLYGGEISYVESNNDTTDLIAGKFRLDCAVASPVPAQRIDMFVEFDVDLLTEAING